MSLDNKIITVRNLLKKKGIQVSFFIEVWPNWNNWTSHKLSNLNEFEYKFNGVKTAALSGANCANLSMLFYSMFQLTTSRQNEESEKQFNFLFSVLILPYSKLL